MDINILYINEKRGYIINPSYIQTKSPLRNDITIL